MPIFVQYGRSWWAPMAFHALNWQRVPADNRHMTTHYATNNKKKRANECKSRDMLLSWSPTILFRLSFGSRGEHHPNNLMKNEALSRRPLSALLCSALIITQGKREKENKNRMAKFKEFSLSIWKYSNDSNHFSRSKVSHLKGGQESGQSF